MQHTTVTAAHQAIGADPGIEARERLRQNFEKPGTIEFVLKKSARADRRAR